jgi:hypothetical protein
MDRKKTLLVLSLLLLVLGMGSVAAGPISQVEGFIIHLDVSEDGTITPQEISLGELSLEVPGGEEPMVLDFDGLTIKNFSQEGLQSLMGSLGLAVDIPRLVIPPEQVEVLAEHGIQSVAIHKKSHGASQEIGLFVNNVKAFEAQASDEALDLTLAELGLLETAESLLSSLLMMDEATISVSFPGATEEPVFTDAIEAEKGKPMNHIVAGAAMAGNEITAVAGVTVDEINEVMAEMGDLMVFNKLVLAPLDELGAGQIVATAGRNGIRVEDDQGKWMEVAWDKESRAALYDLIPVALDLAESADLYMPLDMGMLSMVTSVVEEWLPNTELQFVVHEAADVAVEDTLPEIRVGQVLKVELDEEARLSIGGISLGKTTMDPKALAPYQWAALRFDGKAREIRSVVAGQQMPILFFGDNALAQVGNILAGNLGIPGLEKAPWAKADTLLERIHIQGVELAIAGQAPAEVGLDYSAKKIKLARYAIPSVLVGRQDGHVALGNSAGAVDVTHYLGVMGVPIEDMVKAYVALIPQGLEQASLTVDPNQVTVDLVAAEYNGPILGIRWDSKLRKSLLGLVNQATGMEAMVDSTAQELAMLGLSTGNVSQIEATLLEYLVGAQTLRWGVQVTLIENMEGIPPTAAETVLSQFGLIMLPE